MPGTEDRSPAALPLTGRSDQRPQEVVPRGRGGSMRRVRAAGDNAAMESFFSLLQKNVLDRRSSANERNPLHGLRLEAVDPS
ncbi:hypothetical protein PSCLAVI8L_280013 [Pseudoclavibacter sp. 8L]|nr:hypothetical protein PSCLAVI8L_280013 [Pseudoclavibacter sp. 8L]